MQVPHPHVALFAKLGWEFPLEIFLFLDRNLSPALHH
jgi:hypothetical protein